jgi:hypothetical protein
VLAAISVRCNGAWNDLESSWLFYQPPFHGLFWQILPTRFPNWNGRGDENWSWQHLWEGIDSQRESDWEEQWNKFLLDFDSFPFSIYHHLDQFHFQGERYAEEEGRLRGNEMWNWEIKVDELWVGSDTLNLLYWLEFTWLYSESHARQSKNVNHFLHNPSEFGTSWGYKIGSSQSKIRIACFIESAKKPRSREQLINLESSRARKFEDSAGSDTWRGSKFTSKLIK